MYIYIDESNIIIIIIFGLELMFNNINKTNKNYIIWGKSHLDLKLKVTLKEKESVKNIVLKTHSV